MVVLTCNLSIGVVDAGRVGVQGHPQGHSGSEASLVHETLSKNIKGMSLAGEAAEYVFISSFPCFLLSSLCPLYHHFLVSSFPTPVPHFLSLLLLSLSLPPCLPPSFPLSLPQPHIGVCTCVCWYACPGVTLWKPEVNIRCLSSLFPALLFESGSLTEHAAQAFS